MNNKTSPHEFVPHTRHGVSVDFCDVCDLHKTASIHLFPVRADDLQVIAKALDSVADEEESTEAEIRDRICTFLSECASPGEWRRGNGMKIVSPEGKTYNLRVDDEFNEFLAALRSGK